MSQITPEGPLKGYQILCLSWSGHLEIPGDQDNSLVPLQDAKLELLGIPTSQTLFQLLGILIPTLGKKTSKTVEPHSDLYYSGWETS